MNKMKNLNLLPTDKPSVLGRFIDTNNLFLRVSNDIPRGENVNIYITSDERPSSNDYYIIDDIHEVLKNTFLKFIDSKCKKIILTTDQDLIEDGVQATDDEFLEWFVKNPNCEQISIEELYFHRSGYYKASELSEQEKEKYSFMKTYKIIIPKEESKAKWGIDTCRYFDMEVGCENEKCICENISKEETLEERKPYWNLVDIKAEQNNTIDLNAYANGVEDGVKWQQERMYSEEEVLKIIDLLFHKYASSFRVDAKEDFLLSKKKY